MNNIILNVKNLSYKKIFNDLNMRVEKGTFIAISGANNCGKTTLIKILSGLVTTEHMVKFNDDYLENINKHILFKKEGIVILNDQINFLMNTVQDEISFVINNLNLSEEKKQERYKKIIELFNLKKYEKENPDLLKRSEKIKILLALAVLDNPEILFLDDIFIMMTKAEKKEILAILKKINKKEKTTIIMSVNKLDETIDCDYLYLLNSGKIILEGKPLTILKDDNIINRLGLDIPFMIDLSVKLKDYDLLEDIILDMDRMVDTLWK